MSSKPTDDHPWKNRKKQQHPARFHPWRRRFKPLDYDNETAEAIRRQIEFQRKEGDLDSVIEGYSYVGGGYRRDPVLYDDET